MLVLRRPAPRRLIARSLCVSAPCRGQTSDDMVMGERAAKRTNDMLDRFSNLYVGKNVGSGSRKYGEAYERVFGSKQNSSKAALAAQRTAVLGPGPLGMEISWSVPPVVTKVAKGGAAETAGVAEGSYIMKLNGVDVCVPVPDFELDELMHQRPLRLCVSTEKVEVPELNKHSSAVQKQGVAQVEAALGQDACKRLHHFVLEERKRCVAQVEVDAKAAKDYFSDVQMARASDDAEETRWDMRLPMEPQVEQALLEALSGELGAALEGLVGGDAELWELGVVVSEPGAAAQQVHFDAPERCLFSVFVALQDVTPEMGPTMFLPGTNTKAAHRLFAAGPTAFLEQASCGAALLRQGDAVLYDSRVLHSGAGNASTTSRALLYMSFRPASLDPRKLGIEQHSIRSGLAGRHRLRDFRDGA